MKGVFSTFREKISPKFKPFEVEEECKEKEQHTQSADIEEEIDIKEQQSEWIWVEGVKGTSEDMTCRDYQYEMGELHIHEGSVENGRSGFHFSLQMYDVFKMYPLDFYNRFFRVEALVKKSDYEEASRARRPYLIMGENTNLSSKKIVFIEEFFYKDFEGYIAHNYPFVENQEEYDSIPTKHENYTNFAREKYMNKMKKLGFGETYATVKYGETSDFLELYHFLESAKMFVEEGLGKDMLIYLLERKSGSRK